MNDVQDFDVKDLLEFAEFSPFVQTGYPLLTRFCGNQLQAQVECHYDNTVSRNFLGKCWVAGLGRGFCEAQQ